jgi:hypothetical protein
MGGRGILKTALNGQVSTNSATNASSVHRGFVGGRSGYHVVILRHRNQVKLSRVHISIAARYLLVGRYSSGGQQGIRAVTLPLSHVHRSQMRGLPDLITIIRNYIIFDY